MKTATPVSRDVQDQVRILAIQHGIPEASRISGIKQDTIYKWAMRKHWNITVHQQKQQLVKTVQSSVPDALQDEISKNEASTRLSLSRYTAKASKNAEEATLRDAKIVKDLAGAAAITYQWQGKGNNEQSQVAVNIAILGV